MQAIKNAQEKRLIRLRDTPASKRSAVSDKITFADVDGRTDEDTKLFQNPMSILDHLSGLDDFKVQIQDLIIGLTEARMQGRPLGSIGSWIFLGNPGTGAFDGMNCCAANYGLLLFWLVICGNVLLFGQFFSG